MNPEEPISIDTNVDSPAATPDTAKARLQLPVLPMETQIALEAYARQCIKKGLAGTYTLNTPLSEEDILMIPQVADVKVGKDFAEIRIP